MIHAWPLCDPSPGDAVRRAMKEEVRGVCVAEETMAGGGGGVTQLPPPPAVLSPAPSTTMSPPLSEPEHRAAEHGGRLKFFGKGSAVPVDGVAVVLRQVVATDQQPIILCSFSVTFFDFSDDAVKGK